MNNKLGTLIIKLRKDKNLTQKDLAERLHVSDKAISRWETGNSLPDVDKLLLISQEFNVSLNDLITLRTASTKDSDELVKEMIQEFSEVNKKNAKRLRMFIISFVIIILILAITFIFSHNYNRFKVYKVGLESDNLMLVDGIYVETKIKDSLFLGNISLKNYNIKDTDIVSVELYIKDDDKKIKLQNYTTLEMINFVNSENNIKDLSDYFGKLYLRVTIIPEEGEIQEYTSKVKFFLDFSNNKNYYLESRTADNEVDKKMNNLTEDLIVEKLVKNKFQEAYKNNYRRRFKDYVITYLKDVNKFWYYEEKDALRYKYVYDFSNRILEVNINDKNLTVISNYIYDEDANEVIECNVGLCNDYEYALKVLEEKVLKLLY